VRNTHFVNYQRMLWVVAGKKIMIFIGGDIHYYRKCGEAGGKSGVVFDDDGSKSLRRR
jgi:hypothetical protein